MDKFKKIDKATIIRVAIFAVTIVNLILGALGAYGDFSNELWFRIVSIAATLVSGAVVAWENNDFTFFARLGTGVLDALEDGKVTIDEVEKLLNKDTNTSTDVCSECV